ncbi:MAG: hypothetical protein CMI26_10585 [Opitutae bacterium]|nr:hypothetical protein [Opitutae bacterium]
MSAHFRTGAGLRFNDGYRGKVALFQDDWSLFGWLLILAILCFRKMNLNVLPNMAHGAFL